MDFFFKEIVKKMLERSLKGNDVQKMVEEEGLLRKRFVFKKVNMNISDIVVFLFEFFMLFMEKLREIIFGIYQLKEVKNYVLDNFIEDQFEVFVCNLVENLLRVKLRLRYFNSVCYIVFIYFILDGEISGWYCICKVGVCVVGCCVYVVSVFWYFGYFCFLGI